MRPMMLMMMSLVSAPALLLAAPVSAQPGAGGDDGPGVQERERVRAAWETNAEQALGLQPGHRDDGS